MRLPPTSPQLRPTSKIRSALLQVTPARAYRVVFEDVIDLPFRFTLTNTGLHPIRIVGVEPGCYCTTTSLDTDSLAPGGQVVLSVSYRVISLFNELPMRTIRIKTDDGEFPIIECSVGDFRRQRFIIEPANIDFRAVEVGSAQSQDVFVKSVDCISRLVTDRAVANSPYITVEPLEPALEKPDWQRFRVRLRGECPVGQVEARIFLPRVEDDGIGAMIGVRADVRGPLQVIPPVFFFGMMELGATVSRKGRVEPSIRGKESNEAFDIGGVTIHGIPSGFEAHVDPAMPQGIVVTAKGSKLQAGKFDFPVVVRARIAGKTCDIQSRLIGVVRKSPTVAVGHRE